MELAGKTIVITGAGAGIGAALARRFVREQPKSLILVDIDLDAVEAIAAETGGVPARCDVADEEQVSSLVDWVEKTIAPIDLFCSNAGILAPCTLESPIGQWRRTLDVNLMSHVNAARAVVPRMIERGGGYLLNTASAAGLLNQIGSASYGVSKHAAIGFGEWVALTHGHQGIKVSMLCPQAVDTAMVENGGAMARAAAVDGALSPDAVADCVVDGLAEESFLILPHDKVRDYMARKAEDYEKWLRGMNRLRQKLEENER